MAVGGDGGTRQAGGGVAWQEPAAQSRRPRQVGAALSDQAKGEATAVEGGNGDGEWIGTAIDSDRLADAARYDGLFFILVWPKLCVLLIFSWCRLWANRGLHFRHAMGQAVFLSTRFVMS
ncbi:hypothetical protein SEVIR_5G176000v4 [Setaria viridis]|uniref:Uncharacterized protein n=2 Tax=Setaria TaxID=4554 RepID=A0A368R5T3_SETIT|nr:uncharacterized protein LOC101780424 [Setaria italica]XP_034597198.1 uncharacterized protein LOC117858267 [Setaria viridis]RCV25551.1 hypothetical protein SETIT_5G175700v2 [Setaria italica]TKW14547.1 hypothetical protein SEVIR_5G176000v2 [Setaria viridis]